MLKDIAKEIKKADKIALFHHVHPDGDSISSSYGLLLAIKAKYPKKQVVMVADKNQIINQFPWWHIKAEHLVTKIDSSYITIVGDTAISSRIEYFDEFQKGYKKIVFDHHKSPILPDFPFYIYWREEKFTASAMQATMIAKALRVKLNEDVAFGLMIGLITDSGCFAYSGSDSKVVRIYADLLDYISNERMIEFYNSMKRRTKQDFELLKIIMDATKFSDSTSYVVFDKAFVKKHGRENIKAKVNAIGNIDNYPMWAMFIEKEEKSADGYAWDVSIRSNGPEIVGVAIKYGGGGHAKASGCKLKTKAEIKKVLNDLDELNIL